MNSALIAYETLKNSDSIKQDFGCALPKLSAALLVVNSQICDTKAMAETLGQWHNAQGWYQTHNSTQLGVPTEAASLLEGEWFDGKSSLSIRLLGANQYQVTEYSQEESSPEKISEGTYCYQDQPIWLRGNLLEGSPVNCAVYRQWFQLKDSAYKPAVSQFVGFVKE